MIFLRRMFALLLLLIGVSVLPITASSLFDTVYQSWRNSTELVEQKDVIIPTFLPFSQVLVHPESGKRYLVHLNNAQKPIAVEWLFEDESDAKLKSNRTPEKQLAGMLLWALEQETETMLMYYAQIKSVTMRTAMLGFSKETASELQRLYRKKNIAFEFTQGDEGSELKLVKSKDKTWICTADIKPQLIDFIGNDQNNYAQFLAYSLQSGIVPKWDYARKNKENFASEKELVFQDSLTDHKDVSDDLIGVQKRWLYKTFDAQHFSEKAKISIRIVGRDTIDYAQLEAQAELLDQLMLVLTSSEEAVAMGLASEKQVDATTMQVRWMMIFRNSELGYEHVLRIDQTLKREKTQWIWYNSDLLLMVVNPLLSAG